MNGNFQRDSVVTGVVAYNVSVWELKTTVLSGEARGQMGLLLCNTALAVTNSGGNGL